MSNDLAVAAVTAVLRAVLERALAHTPPRALDGARVTTVRPDRLAIQDGPGLNVFLYGVSPNHGWNLHDLPTRGSDSALRHPPLVALDLHYLLSAYGADDALDAQRMIARAMAALHRDAVLARPLIASVLDDLREDHVLGFLAEADLADQVELVKLTAQSLSLDELSKLWSMFVQAPFELSVAYTASVVLVESDVDLRAPLPVREPRVVVSPGPLLQLTSLGTRPGPTASGAGTEVVLDGTGLSGPHTEVHVGPATLTPREGTATRLTVLLDATVPAGVHAVRVRHREPVTAGGAELRMVAQSNVLALTVRPSVVPGPVTGTTVVLRIDPPVQPGQQVRVQLDPLPDEAGTAPTLRARTIRLPPRAPGQGPLQEHPLDLADVPVGPWLLRVQVDGVDSTPEVLGDLYAAPTVTVSAP
ncbi:Pvc16 family protein [Actinomycetospora flava]|uniref:Pvc16 family protein n=1 Tax=Actinomycetospora flava TaxID=3129232 RepID=A0ABU8M7G6_9PSEU